MLRHRAQEQALLRAIFDQRTTSAANNSSRSVPRFPSCATKVPEEGAVLTRPEIFKIATPRFLETHVLSRGGVDADRKGKVPPLRTMDQARRAGAAPSGRAPC